ncbi:hypothetical protein BC829DRAFT_384989 [Chytridium lagenaria]|nr:hypothetical protein BC829DRAFT_384989 [Chytridium lagenaria]
MGGARRSRRPAAVSHMVECVKTSIGFLNVLISMTVLNFIALIIVALLSTFIKTESLPYFANLIGDWGLIPMGCSVGFLVLLIHNWRRLLYVALHRHADTTKVQV